MAYRDYLHCDVCDTKSIYDANIDYDNVDLGDISVLCGECSKTYKICLKRKKSGREKERKHTAFGLEEVFKQCKKLEADK